MLGLIGLLVYAALLVRFPAGRYIAVPLANVGSITKLSPWAAFLIACAGIMLHAAYAAAVLVCWRSQPDDRGLALLIWGYAIAASAMLFFIWPITSTDLFDYIFRGHMGAYYHVSPYTIVPNRYSNDPLYRYLGWPNAPSAYGPLWELISARMAAIGGMSPWTNLLLQKAFALLTFLLCGVVLMRMLREAGREVQLLGGLLWLWSPLALFEIVGMGHNDGLLVLSVLLAIWATRHGRYHWAAVALVIGALFKFLPLILLPFVVVYGARRRATWAARVRLALEIGLITVVLIVVCYAPYWEGTKTLANITLREKFLNAAPLAILTYTLSQRWSIDVVRPTISMMGSAILAIGLLWQMWQIWRYDRDLRTACFGIFAWYLIIGSQWFQPWYVLWLLAMLALQPSRETFGWVETWAISGQASYLLQYFILTKRWSGLAGNQLPGQVLYLLLIFVPPLIVWSIERLRRRSSPPAVSQPGPALAV
jgi:hypothetical protein